MAAGTTAGSAEIIALDKNIIEIKYHIDAVDTVYDVTGKIYYTGEARSICEFDIPGTEGLYVDTPTNMGLDITKPISIDIVVHNEMGAPGEKSIFDIKSKPQIISITQINTAKIPSISNTISQAENTKLLTGGFTYINQIIECNKTEQIPEQTGEITT